MNERQFLPMWCREFIYSFDAGKFPNIVKKAKGA